MSIKTVPVEAVVTMTATANIQHMCPFVHEVDNGAVTISWTTEGWTVELHSLRAYLGTFHDREISHEELTEEIRAEISSHHGIESVRVESSWRTAGMGIACSTWATRAARR